MRNDLTQISVTPISIMFKLEIWKPKMDKKGNGWFDYDETKRWNGMKNDLKNKHEPILENIDPNAYKFSRWSDGV